MNRNLLLEEAYKNFRKGDPLSDKQLKMLIENHKTIVKETEGLNDRRFDLFTSKIRSDLYILSGYEEARKRNK